MEDTNKQGESSDTPSIAALRPFQWRKGQSGNPMGRTKGKTMKEYARDLLSCQTEEERQEYLHGLSKDTIWKMAEGNPVTIADVNITENVAFTKEQINATRKALGLGPIEIDGSSK